MYHQTLNDMFNWEFNEWLEENSILDVFDPNYVDHIRMLCGADS